MEADRLKFLSLLIESVRIIRNPVRIPLVSNSLGFCHVITIEVEDTAVTATLVGGPLGAVYMQETTSESSATLSYVYLPAGGILTVIELLISD